MDNSNDTGSAQFGYELIRDYVLPSILGQHEEEILYWSGKELARKFPLQDPTEIIQFFERANWGMLSLEKLSKSEASYRLAPTADASKLIGRKYSMEAGFIAEQYQNINGLLTECFASAKQKGAVIDFQVKWDNKTAI